MGKSTLFSQFSVYCLNSGDSRLRNFLNLGDYDNFQEKLLVNQMESRQTIMVSMKQTLDEFGSVVASFEKTVSYGRQLTKDVSESEQRISFNSCVVDCMEKLKTICDIHISEYRPKSSLIAALWPLTFNPNADDLSALSNLS